ncbi:MAG: signal peptide peptidase SppA [Proteobacteria bacterium]|nr:signal peptide peptidase SppA [Pseudomonadota bacterium]
MNLHDVMAAPWAITPKMFATVREIYDRHARGEKLDAAALEAAIGKSSGGKEPDPYDLIEGVAVVPMVGVLAKRMNLFTAISGGTSMQLLADAISQAVADPLARGVILAVDSPGGTVDGSQELSDLIFALRSSKPIVALADGMMGSAAYWIGSAAQAVYATSTTAQVGSIGVVATHQDVSGAEAQSGVKTTEITAGKYKRIASEYAPLTPEGRQAIQDQVDYTYSIFVDAVARNRDASVDSVLENMADGRVFMGQQAVDAGLADGIATLSQLITRMNAGQFDPVTTKETTMDIAEMKTKHPDIAAALIAEGARAERERIQAVEAAALPGHEALIGALKFDGKTTGGEAALQVLVAERSKRGDRLEALRKDAGSAAVPHAAAPPPGDEDDEDEEDDNEDDDPDASASPDGPASQPAKKASKKKAAVISLAQAGAVARRARAYQDEEAAKGHKVSAAEAVAHVEQQLKQEGRRHG